MNPAPYIAARGLSKKFGPKTALRNIDLVMEKGDSLALFGPNGAGKSTLIQVLCSLLSPTSGSVRIAGCDPRKDREELHRIVGVIGHQTYLYPHLTARENLTFYGTLYGVARLKDRVEEVLEMVGLGFCRNDAVQGFSRGMQQRLSIGRAILHDPLILFLDEPFTGLDQQGSERLIELVAGFRSQEKTIVMASHQIRLGLTLCERAAILKAGRIVYIENVTPLSKSDFSRIYREHVEEKVSQLKVA